MSNPWLKFYPRDWRGDQALRAVSVAARGLWIEMLCVMHEAQPYGHLILAGQAVSNDVLARVAGLGAEECGALIAELESAGVLSRTRKGVIYSRRMVKDHSRSEKGRKSIARRWKQEPENKAENERPNRSPNNTPITQKPEARVRKKDKPSSLTREDKPLSSRAIPEWLPRDEWRGFVSMRRKIKKPLTDRAVTMALRKLGELRDGGEDPAAVLDQSTLHCWQDLYPIRQEQRAQPAVPL